tara:strand:+ start:195 stop:479 length:285 start_codon:yes stop_codon:yes gene_type:complete
MQTSESVMKNWIYLFGAISVIFIFNIIFRNQEIQKWEYKVVLKNNKTHPIINRRQLDSYGEDGWELSDSFIDYRGYDLNKAANTVFIFKRKNNE